MRVYDIFKENLVDSSGVDVYLRGEPCVGMTLAAKLLADKLSDVYLHYAIAI